MGVCVMLVAVAIAGLATWMSSKNSEDDLVPKIIWAVAQISSVMVLFIGALVSYLAYTRTHPVAPLELPTREATATVGPRAVPKRAPKAETPLVLEAFLNVRVIDASNSAAISGAQVAVDFGHNRMARTGQTDGNGVAAFPGEPVGIPVSINISAPAGLAGEATASLNRGDSTIVVSLKAPEPTADAAPNTPNPSRDVQAPVVPDGKN